MGKWLERLRVPISIAIVLGLWQFIYVLGIVNPKYFPSVPSIAAAFWTMTSSGELLKADGLTFGRALVGLIGAGVLGIAFAILSDVFPVFGKGFGYISDILQPIPPAAFVPMAVFSLGLGFKLYAFVIILVTVWPPYLNGVAGLNAVSPVQLNTGRMLGCNKWDLLWRI
jgi:ABC-type nitrate/sulfonate/bicarbonate transport system permease component